MDRHLREVERRKKVITCGTAVGAKQGRAKGNKQKAESTEPEKKARETRPEIRGKPGKREWNRSTGTANCEAKTGRKC